ncbi:hypothetical protein EYF80_044792 [Liparis tanakae]|uniref:Uncharacterized protein n=1 Tax=Liparis tanakae TaxID=230148 RepID=A0A4Z2FUP3_9TELE|nr:hypothetical protein EYF80_044792 [Liparis tanakae]
MKLDELFESLSGSESREGLVKRLHSETYVTNLSREEEFLLVFRLQPRMVRRYRGSSMASACRWMAWWPTVWRGNKFKSPQEGCNENETRNEAAWGGRGRGGERSWRSRRCERGGVIGRVETTVIRDAAHMFSYTDPSPPPHHPRLTSATPPTLRLGPGPWLTPHEQGSGSGQQTHSQLGGCPEELTEQQGDVRDPGTFLMFPRVPREGAAAACLQRLDLGARSGAQADTGRWSPSVT